MSAPSAANGTEQFGVVGILGGTGAQGRGLATRFARAGLSVVLGSRDAARARDVAHALPILPTSVHVDAATNADAAAAADIVIVAVPWAGHDDALIELRDALAGKLVVDCVNPIGFDEHGAYALDVAAGSAAQSAAQRLPQSRVVAAFHHISAVLLNDATLDRIECDVFVAGDDRESTDQVQALAELIPGVRGVYAGRLRNSRQLEALTANLVSINRRYRTHAGVRVTGL